MVFKAVLANNGNALLTFPLLVELLSNNSDFSDAHAIASGGVEGGELEIAALYGLLKLHLLKIGAVHNVTELACSYRFAPGFAVCADMELVFVHGADRVAILAREVEEGGQLVRFSHVHDDRVRRGLASGFLVAMPQGGWVVINRVFGGSAIRGSGDDLPVLFG